MQSVLLEEEKKVELIVEPEAEEKWDLVIEPKSGLFDLRLKEVWNYRDLLVLFVKRDFKAQYKQTILGPLWHFIQPIFTTVVFLVVFSNIANIPTDGIPPILFYLSGITIWNYFASCLNGTSNTFVANAGIFGKVYFPRMILPLATVLSNLVKFSIQFLLLLSLLIYFSIQGVSINIGWSLLVLPLLLVVLAGLGLGLGIIISSLTTKYRDFSVLIGFGVQLLMYATPVVYPLSFLVEKSYRWFIVWNPLTPLVEAFRYALFGQGTVSASSILYSFGFMLVILLVGLIIFHKVERSFMDTV
ncbi:lipopolysaccharide transport system permease protein [Pontibacter ummariensis]|uniref:Transport permease protein n=1 Tax=Pontibacter ummariensis TaxID=1610492 RepID=A0A239BNE6_9BACT|nr:ABC transporter permease [Pontibacter ummariensis]PRY15778.1 lipopolysaccharide transport system permease protein [Pontibacter ummariensis]SNS08554.1 lipopolysaccharide transport system permease protein [Pontibacter ummariensis]